MCFTDETRAVKTVKVLLFLLKSERLQTAKNINNVCELGGERTTFRILKDIQRGGIPLDFVRGRYGGVRINPEWLSKLKIGG